MERYRAFQVILLAVMTTLAACDDSEEDPCVPGAERECSCDDGNLGLQACGSAGWGDCLCEAGGDGDGDIDGDADGDLDGDADSDGDADEDHEPFAPGAACDCDDECPAVEEHEGACLQGVCVVLPDERCGEEGSSGECPEGFRCWSVDERITGLCLPDCSAHGCAGECDSEDACRPTSDTSCDPACGPFCCGDDLPRYCESGDIVSCSTVDSDCSTLSECRGEVFICGLGERPICPDEGSPSCEPIEGWVVVPGGTFVMGSPAEDPERRDNEFAHEVTLTRPFAIGTVEVTREQWDALMESNPSLFPACGPTCPIDNVSWEAAVTYTNLLSESEGFHPCYSDCACFLHEDYESPYECTGYRLPTEAEWEYAARAGVTDPRYGNIDEIAWYAANSDERTHEGAGLAPNPWGLYDMLGNVAEWCSDKYLFELGTDPVTDPFNGDGVPDRAMRGGTYENSPTRIRAAFRTSGNPGIRVGGVGFRVVRSLP